MKKPAWIVMDIEGTTSSVSFVHDVLFPYAFKNLEKFIQNNKHDQMVAEALSETARIVRETEGRDIFNCCCYLVNDRCRLHSQTSVTSWT